MSQCLVMSGAEVHLPVSFGELVKPTLHKTQAQSGHAPLSERLAQDTAEKTDSGVRHAQAAVNR